MGKDSPDPPDYRGAAKEQAQASAEITNMQTYANRPTQNTPWGSTTWDTQAVIDPATGQQVTQWEQNQTLSPELQQALDAQMGLQSNRSQLAGSMYDRVASEFDPTVDFDQFDEGGNRISAYQTDTSQLPEFMGLSTAGLPSADPNATDRLNDYSGISDIGDPERLRQRAEDAAYSRATSRLDPQFEQRNEQLEAKLRNQGLRPGDQAYDTAMENFGRERTDAYDQATWGSINAGRAEAGQLFDQDVTRRGVYTGEEDRQTGLFNSTGQQEFAQSLASRGMQFGERGAEAENIRNQREQMLSEQLRSNAQDFGQEKSASAYNTQLRQQQIAEEMQKRGFTLNEINALLTGQQVNTPNMPNFSEATKSETPQYMRGAENQYQGELDQFNAGQQQLQGGMSGLGSMFMMSDIRLKENIRMIKEHPTLPLRLYSWDWNSTAFQLGVNVFPTEGVIAQEVMRVFPEAVVQTDSGMLAVDYQLLATYEEALL